MNAKYRKLNKYLERINNFILIRVFRQIFLLGFSSAEHNLIGDGVECDATPEPLP